MFKELIEEGKRSRERGLDKEKNKIRPEVPYNIKVLVDELNEIEKQTLLAMTMESLRGFWGDIEERVSIIFYLCDIIEKLPPFFLNAVRHNVYMIDGELIDGRIFRDGDRLHGLSGNLAYSLTGDDRFNQNGYYGTYNELWAIIGKDKSGRQAALKIIHLTADLTFEDETS